MSTPTLTLSLDRVLDIFGEETSAIVDLDELYLAHTPEGRRPALDVFYDNGDIILDCPDGVKRVLSWSDDDEQGGETVAANFVDPTHEWYLTVRK